MFLVFSIGSQTINSLQALAETSISEPSNYCLILFLKSRATGCFAFSCSLCSWSGFGATIVFVCHGRNKSYPPNTWCKRTSATENTGLFFHHPFPRCFGLFWLWKHKTCHSWTLGWRNRIIILNCEDKKISYLKLQKSKSISCFHKVSSSISITARDKFLSGLKEKLCTAQCAHWRGEPVSNNLLNCRCFVWDFE